MKSAKCEMQDVSNQGSSRLRPKRANSGGTSAIDLHGGRIVRSAGRKDRHSKVCTARGPRDRRVRLSPNTAIQFYDVQDRLGYDRPSKAIDWLMKEAKAAIDALDDSSHAKHLNDATLLMHPSDHDALGKALEGQEESNCSKSACGFHSQEEYLNDISIGNFSLFSGDNGSVAVAPPSTTFHAYPNGDLSSRNKSQAQGLSLSFHTFQDCSFMFSNGQQHGLIPDSTPTHCGTNTEVVGFQKLLGWNSNSSNVKDSQESLLNSLPLHLPSHYDQNHLHFQREPLQSSFCPTIRDPLHNQFSNLNYAGTRLLDDGGLSGLSTAARIQGLEGHNPTSGGKPFPAASLLHYQD